MKLKLLKAEGTPTFDIVRASEGDPFNAKSEIF
jgi:hypothetical protein